MALVEVSDLTKTFGTFRAVDGITFNVDRGEVLGFLGPNGAGKSTSMKMIAGFLNPTAGKVVIGGDSVASRPIAVKKRIGYLPEGAPLYPDMTPESFLAFVAAMHGMRGDKAQQAVDTAVARVQLSSVLGQSIDTLSKGYKRRVGLAQAIIHDPEVLILDEPTDGLDPNQKHEVRALIRAMASDKAIILSTHILEEVDAVCSRCIVINNGKVVVDDAPASLMTRSPMHNVVRIQIEGEQAENLQAALQEIPSVAKVEVSANQSTGECLAYPVDGKSILADITALIRARGWQVVNLNVEKGHLDEVFRKLTRADAA